MPVLLRRIMKYRRCDAFVVISSMCDCHFTSSDRVTPSRRVPLTWIGLPSMVSSAMSGVDFLKHIRSSFTLSLFSAILLLAVHCPTSSAATWSELPIPYDKKVSDIVQSLIWCRNMGVRRGGGGHLDLDFFSDVYS